MVADVVREAREGRQNELVFKMLVLLGLNLKDGGVVVRSTRG